MEFLYLLGGLIALLLGTDTATKGLSGALQQAGCKPLAAGLALVAVGYALPGLAVLVGAYAWSGLSIAAAAAHGAMLGTLAIGAAGLLLTTGLVLRVRPWAMLKDEKARAELAEFAASREGWGRNLFRLALGALLLIAGARGVLAAAPLFAGIPEASLASSTAVAAALAVGFSVGVVATFNARFGDAAAAFAAILGGGSLLVLAATALAVANAAPAMNPTLLAHPLPQGALLLVALALIAKPIKPIGRGAGALLLALAMLSLAAVVHLSN